MSTCVHRRGPHVLAGTGAGSTGNEEAMAQEESEQDDEIDEVYEKVSKFSFGTFHCLCSGA